ncbi:MAG TPA: LytTR family DNA-binding domain-containing protein, partial [Povalibacter sp.]
TRARLRLAARQANADGEGSDPAFDVDALVNDARRRQGPLERVLIRDGAQVHVIATDRIDYVEAQDDYLAFSIGGKQLRKQQTMSDLESQLDPSRFVRIHRSFILNIERLARIDLYGKDSWLAILSDGSKLPMSRTGHAKLKELIG